MNTSTSPDLHSEDSVFRKLFSNEPKPRKTTKAERMERIFAGASKDKSAINVSDFLPRY